MQNHYSSQRKDLRQAQDKGWRADVNAALEAMARANGSALPETERKLKFGPQGRRPGSERARRHLWKHMRLWRPGRDMATHR